MKSAPSAKYKLHREHSHANSDSDFNSKTLSHVESGKWQVASVFRCNPNQHDWPSASHTANPIASHPSYPIPFPGCWIEMATRRGDNISRLFAGFVKYLRNAALIHPKKRKALNLWKGRSKTAAPSPKNPGTQKKTPYPACPLFCVRFHASWKAGKLLLLFHFFMFAPPRKFKKFNAI